MGTVNNKGNGQQLNPLTTILKGLCVGGTMLVPGVSGGSMAMILGIYSKLISSISSFRMHKKASILLLGLFSMGGLLGMVIFANPLQNLIRLFPKPMLYFFIGAVIGGVPMIYAKAELKKVTWELLLYPIIGFLIVFLLSNLPADTFQSDGNNGIGEYLLLLGAGVIAAIALVLPGISVSYMLLIMGMYDKTMKAISGFLWSYLLPLGIGLGLGIILTTKLLEQAMVNYPRVTYLVILGFILGSLMDVFPGVPSGGEIVVCSLTAVAGYGIIRIISKMEV